MALIISSGHFYKVVNGKETVIFFNNATGRCLKKLYEKLNEPIEKKVRIDKWEGIKMSMEQAERDYLQPPECGEPCGYCDICGEPIYEDDTYYKIGGENYCEDCINRHKKTAYGEI